ncbi:helix-turn-helix transcriptional regulator [Nitratidesulfovibrio termitidis]|uniref:helix-turn-helix transcriptional regulator n=1 Tax=Nitratidesulfovibrio termitidis TaxID=42252 RepID=UPI0003FDB27A|nr:helix-turn-helix transcriptional regulator [Nitratidesulfovibrio termitidis]
MSKPTTRAYSRHTTAALVLLGNLIREARTTSRLTAGELAERAGISRDLLRRVERGDPGCSIGVVFEVATLLGVPLMEADPRHLALRLQHSVEKRALLPKAVHAARGKVKDDF